MDDLRTLVRDEMARAGSPSYSFNDLGRRRDRKRRNQRIAAGVVGIAVFVGLIWIVTSGLSFDRTETPAVPGPAETGPADAAPTPASDIISETGPLGMGCSAGAGVHLVITDIGDRFAVRFEVHRSPVGHSWHIVLLHQRISGAAGFIGTVVPTSSKAPGWQVESGGLVVQRSVVDKGWVDGFRAEAVDRQTGQVCRQSARILPG